MAPATASLERGQSSFFFRLVALKEWVPVRCSCVCYLVGPFSCLCLPGLLGVFELDGMALRRIILGPMTKTRL